MNAAAAYAESTSDFGQVDDPMVGSIIGGVNVFGGGLALYFTNGELRGGLGVSGDSSCADHNIAWRVRHALNFDFVPAGVSGDPDRQDNIAYDIKSHPFQMNGVSASWWGHPVCSEAAKSIAASLPPTQTP